MDFNYDTGTISEILNLDPGSSSLSIGGTSGLILPSGTTAQRDPGMGVIRVNTDTSTVEWYNGASWITFGANTGNLASIAGLSGTGFVSRVGADTFIERSIVGSLGRVTVTNGNGVSGNPTVDLATAGTAGSYVVTVTDAYGRVTSGSTSQAWSTIVSTPTSLAGYGILDAVTNAGGVPSLSAGILSARPTASSIGRVYIATDTLAAYYDTGIAWSLISPAVSGDVTIPAGSTTATLATVNPNVGAFGSATSVPVITVNAFQARSHWQAM